MPWSLWMVWTPVVRLMTIATATSCRSDQGGSSLDSQRFLRLSSQSWLYYIRMFPELAWVLFPSLVWWLQSAAPHPGRLRLEGPGGRQPDLQRLRQLQLQGGDGGGEPGGLLWDLKIFHYTHNTENISWYWKYFIMQVCSCETCMCDLQLADCLHATHDCAPPIFGISRKATSRNSNSANKLSLGSGLN